MTSYTAAQIFRDYSTDGVPSSGAHKPVKSEIREYLGDRVEKALNYTEVTKTAAYTVLVTDVGKTILLNKATADTLSFDPAATLGTIFSVLVKNIGVGVWTLDPSGAETIDGVTSITLAENESCVVTCNGTALRTMFRNQFESSDAGASAGPVLDLYRNSASPAASDQIGEVDFNGRDSAANKQLYASIGSRISDATSGSEDASLTLSAVKAGTLTDLLHVQRNAAGNATADVVALPRGQLSFPAAQNASSDPNTLDDYEEGTWTPGLTFNGSASGITYSVQTGIYVKVGKKVRVEGRIVLTNNGSGSGAARLTGLPFAGDNSGFGGLHALYWSGTTSIVGNPVALVDGGATTAQWFMSGGSGSVSIADTNFGNSLDIQFSGEYIASA